MRKATVRVGIIGRGFGARVVAPVFAETDGCEVVSVVSPRASAEVRALCRRDDVDLVAVHSPPFLHLEHVRTAVEAGKAVLCDKPFGCSAAEAGTMLDLAGDAGVVHLLNFEFRCHPGREALRSLMIDGAVGGVEHLQWTQLSAGSVSPLRRYGWLFDRRLGGGWVGAWGSHAIDFLLWSLGPLPEAAAHLRTTIDERPDEAGRLHPCTAEDGFTAWLRSAAGVTVTIDTTFAAPVNLPSRVIVTGSAGVLEVVGDRRITLHTDAGRSEPFAFDHGNSDPHLLPMRRWAVEVRDAVAAGSTPPGLPTFTDGLACAEVMDRLRAGSPPLAPATP
ncbi:MAG: Gfo/Idh/MocA family protein [Actinomycetota bacterium]